ncbi:MAG: NADH-quinone oxidoreductase subunit NuoB [Thermoplasmata archaeon]|nr:NADH-quinone oxidoreductase subunit NuoB [Thermoplasmata archaeon]
MDIDGKIGAVMLMRSKDFLAWVDDWFGRVLKRGPIGRGLDVLLTDFWTWARVNSLYPLHFGIMCCALEMAAASAPRFDAQRLGVIYRSTPRQCDILLVNGPVSKKLKPDLRRLYDQMSEPKWVVAMGECAISGGPFWQSYSIVEGVDQFIPVDIYIPGCPVRPEAMLEGFMKLQDKIRKEKKGALTEEMV